MTRQHKMTWFRLYHEFTDDTKVLRLPERAQLFLVKLWCVASKQKERGTLPDLTEISLHVRLSEADTSEFLGVLKTAGFINEDETTKALTIHGWNKRQYASDDSTPRSQRRRNGHATAMQRPCNADATPVQRPQITDTEAEIQNTPLPPKGEVVGSVEPEPFESEPDASGGFAPCIPMNAPVNPALSAVAILAEELFPMREFGRKAEEDAKFHGPVVVERAMKEAKATEVSSGKRIGNWKYMQPIIERIKDEIRNPLSKRSWGESAEPKHGEPGYVPPSQRVKVEYVQSYRLKGRTA